MTRYLAAISLCFSMVFPLSAFAASKSVVVYSGRGEALVGPLFAAFEKKTGIKADVRYNDTAALATQLISEAESSPADVVFFQESGYLGVLEAAGLLAKLPKTITAQTDPRFNDPDGYWVGTSGRARVLVYNTEAVKAGDLPLTLEALADPKWKGKLGWAPSNASFQAHVSVLRHVWGNTETRAWLKKMQALAPKVYPKNSPQVEAADNGEIAIGWVNHYYLHKLRKPGYKVANYSFRTAGDPGNILMVSGAAIRKGAKNRQAAQRLLEFLVGEQAQKMIAEDGYEYPTRPDVPTQEHVPPLDSLNLAIVDQAQLTDLVPTLAMLRELGLL